MAFLVIYLREAHAIDGPSPLGGEGMPILEEPITLDERREVAEVCMGDLALDPIPALVDGMDDAVGSAYAAHPDRLYLVGRDGRIAYHGFEGPFGFDPEELADALLEELAR